MIKLSTLLAMISTDTATNEMVARHTDPKPSYTAALLDVDSPDFGSWLAALEVSP